MQILKITLPKDVDLQNVKMIIAATLYEQGVFSSSQAAVLAEITKRQFIEEVGQYGVSVFGESVEDIDKLSKRI